MDSSADKRQPDRPHPVTIIVNRREVEMPDNHATGREIKAAADVPETFKLFDPHGDEVANDQRIKIHNKQKFTAISGQDVS